MNGDLTILSRTVLAMGHWDIADALDSMDDYLDTAAGITCLANAYVFDRPQPTQSRSLGNNAARVILGLISDCARLGIDIQEEIARELGRHR